MLGNKALSMSNATLKLPSSTVSRSKILAHHRMRAFRQMRMIIESLDDSTTVRLDPDDRDRRIRAMPEGMFTECLVDHWVA